MDTLEPQHSITDVKLSNSPLQDCQNEVIKEENNYHSHSDRSLSDEEDVEKQFTIEDQENDEKEKYQLPVNLQHGDTQEPIIKYDIENTIKREFLTAPEEPCDTEKDFEVENDTKIIQTPILKLNGNHSVSLNDEDSCSSTTSSTSSHNLVIDHPLAEEQPPPVSLQENNLPDVQKVSGLKPLKRKLSSCENNDAPKNKHICLDSTIKSPDKEVHKQQNPLLAVEHKTSIAVESPPPTSLFWEKSKQTSHTYKEEPQPTNSQYMVKFVDEHVAPLSFSKQIQAHSQENNSLIVKKRSSTTYDSNSQYQSNKAASDRLSEIKAPSKILSPQTYGPYPVYSSNAVPLTSEIFPSSPKQLTTTPATHTRIVAITSGKESNQQVGSYDLYTTQTGKSLPPPKLNFECFKCKRAVFESFAQLRDHQKSCFYKDNHKKQTQITSASPDPIANAKEKALALSNTPGPPELVNSVTTATATATAIPKKHVYLCSSCGTYHENWNLFLHIREIHNRHVCLYCIRLFPTAEKLSLHLEIKHDLEQNHFNSEEKIRSVSKGDGNSRFLLCCTCQHVFSEHERFSDHQCTEYIQPCSLCGQKGRHLSNCKANPEKRPKTKRKAKPIAASASVPALASAPGPSVAPAPIPATVPKIICKVPKTSTAMSTFSTPAQVSDSKSNNNNNHMPLTALPHPLQTISTPFEFSKQNGYPEMSTTGSNLLISRTKPPSEELNYHSDDSTNMVIDETCSSNNYFNQMPAVNPFKALDERERQEAIQKTAEIKSTLPPDRVPEAIPEPKPLIVPKIKLCVPREFQKAVDMEISSSDSNEDEDLENDEDQDDQENRKLSNVDNNSSSADEKESGQEECNELHSKLDRIIKAIAKTRSEIQRTKEKMKVPCEVVEHSIDNYSIVADALIEPGQGHPEVLEQKVPPHAEVLAAELPINDDISQAELIQGEISPMNRLQDSIPDPQEGTSSLTERVCDLENSNLSPISKNETVSGKTPERGMYSPTPPASPNSAWISPYRSEDSPTVLQAVSERENIENIEKECEHSKDQSPEISKLNSSSEHDVDSIQNQEESTMDIEEKSKQTPPSSSPLQGMDFSPAIETEKKLDQGAPTDEAIIPAQDIDDEDEEVEVVKDNLPPADGIEVANEDVLVTDLLLDRPIEKFEIVEFVRLCVKAVYSLCLYCNHARRIAVCGHSLVLHLLAQHRFAATVDSITAEELLPSTIVSKLKSFLPDLEDHYFNLESYSTFPPKENTVNLCNERVFECFQCRFSTRMHKDLYLHNRKMHLKTAILCFMCRSNFFSFSEILCHICPGTPNKVTVFDIKFRCCLCEVDEIPSPFRLMVHLRKKHFACDICLEDCHVQAKLSSHVWKHKLHHLCYRCGIAYRNKMDITKHLFWKHGTESIICKRCLQKRWRHVYHFCVPPTSFTCDVCSLCFSKATYLKVHQREHTGDFRYPCTEDNCEEKFISRKLLLKHSVKHAPPIEVKPEEDKKQNVEDIKSEHEAEVKKEETSQQDDKPLTLETTVDKEEEKKSDDKKEEESPEVGLKRKKKKSRNKESLEDLNLIAPNLSESDSSGDSDSEKPKSDNRDSLVPNVMLSPQSEEDKDEDKLESTERDAGKIMDIWENFKSFQASQQAKKDEDDDNKSFTDTDYPTPILHVASSDHDYCGMYKVRQRVVTAERPSQIPVSEEADINSDTEAKVEEVMKRKELISPTKKKRKSTGSHSSSSGSSSDSSSRSSCSCKTNCSCSSSSSGSGSSSSSDDSDSSTSEGRRRISKKRQEKAERSRLKSECSQKISLSESVDVGVPNEKEPSVLVDAKEKLEPILIETDLETAESETDEEFYDEHPQKLASEILAEKRLQLQDRMRLSPSHNFDIMENSRPSTPSLPEEMIKEKKVKIKKKKRDRKSSSKSQAVPPIKLNLSINKVEILNNDSVIRNQTAMQVPEVDLIPPYDLIASPGVAEPPVAQQPISVPINQNHTVKPVPFFHTRMSEGSSCSDADNSLKRSQRARRPNKFYGYTSDDESTPGPPLMIGSRTFKPQPPPQLTWRKEDLPAPSKSMFINKQPRTPKTPIGQKGQIKKRVHQKPNSLKKKQHRLPPIPTLKIRPPKINKPPFEAVALPPPPPPIATHQTYSSSRDESDDTDSSDEDLELPAVNSLPSTPVVPKWNTAPAPAVIEPTPAPPQASVFNQKIPPALLPNPDFATIQYFKRNNIRYPIAPPAGARQARDGESVYCYCRCPYDEVSEMIACDGENCVIEWFHFECVGIMVAPQGKWFCAECRPKYSNELYPKLS